MPLRITSSPTRALLRLPIALLAASAAVEAAESSPASPAALTPSPSSEQPPAGSSVGRACNSGLQGDLKVAACAKFCTERQASNHCRFCKCASCSFCVSTQQPSAVRGAPQRETASAKGDGSATSATSHRQRYSSWHQVGYRLLAAFEHITIVSLPRSVHRRERMVNLLRQLGLVGATERYRRYSFVSAAADCTNYNQWTASGPARELLVPQPNGTGQRAAWWLHPSTCRKTAKRHQLATRGGCLQPELDPCRASTALQQLPNHSAALCGGVCYSLSVASALREFLRSGHRSLLLLEDDACLTKNLLRSGQLFKQLARREPGTPFQNWSIARLGHCFHKVKLHGKVGEGISASGLMTHKDDGCDAELTPSGPTSLKVSAVDAEHVIAADANTSAEMPFLKPGLGRSFCSHALGLTRLGAERLLRLAYPVTAVLDDVLFALDGGLGQGAQYEMLRRAGAESIGELGAVHVSRTLFSQRSKDTRFGEASLTLNTSSADDDPAAHPLLSKRAIRQQHAAAALVEHADAKKVSTKHAHHHHHHDHADSQHHHHNHEHNGAHAGAQQQRRQLHQGGVEARAPALSWDETLLAHRHDHGQEARRYQRQHADRHARRGTPTVAQGAATEGPVLSYLKRVLG